MKIYVDKVLGVVRERAGLTEQEVKQLIKNTGINGEVDKFDDLPDATSDNANEVWLVRTSSGTIFINRHKSGLYKSDGNNWIFLNPNERWSGDSEDMRTTELRNINLKNKGLKDNNVTTAVNLGDSDNTALNTSNTTILGGINEVKGITDNKQDILSEGAFVDGDKTKLDGIADNAQVNVQSDYNETDDTKDSFVKNKPDLSVYQTIANMIDEDDMASNDDTKYPTQQSTKAYVDSGLSGKQDSLGYTAENQANKSTDTELGTSDTLYPTQNATKTYVDNGLSNKLNNSGGTLSGKLQIDTTGRALEITGNTTVDGDDVQIYLGNGVDDDSQYGYNIKYEGSGSGNTNAFVITSVGQNDNKEIIRSNIDGIVNLPQPGAKVNGNEIRHKGNLDYRTGAWTPTVYFDDNKLDIKDSDGWYIKIGNLVTVSFVFNEAQKGSNTGQIRLKGLPFNIVNKLDKTSHEANGNISYSNNFTTTPYQLIAYEPGYLILMNNITGLSDGDVNDKFSLRGSISYWTND